MALISEDKIEQIRNGSNIVDIVSEYVDLKRAGSTFKGLCPFHNEKTPSFTVDDKKQLFHCFGCGAGGDVVSFIMQKESLSYPEALEYLAHKAGIELTYNDNYNVNPKNQALYDINYDVMMYFYRNLLTNKDAITYLKSRGLSSRIVNIFMLGYANNSWHDLTNYIEAKGYDKEDMEAIGLIKKSDKGHYYDKYRNRIIFPIINHYGKVIGFGGRAIADEMPKYLNSPESDIFKKRYNLYGLNIYKKQKGRNIILVEGYMDVIALNNHGIDYAVASLGTALTEDQAKLINRYSDDVYICYDRDGAGIKATDKAIEIFLEVGVKPKIIQLPEGKDPDDFIKENGKEAFINLMDESLDVYNYKYNKILDIYSISNQNEKYEKLDLFVEFLASIESDLTRDIFANNISTLFKIDKTTLNQAVNKYNTNISYKNAQKTKSGEVKPKVILENKTDSKFDPMELEIVRLLYKKPDEFHKNKDVLLAAITNKKIKNVTEFFINKDSDKFNANDEDYTYILNYVRDDDNPIDIDDLIDRIELYQRIKKLESFKNKAKGSINE